MAFLSFIYKHGIWISIPAFIFFLVLLIVCITGVVRTGRQARLLSVPLVDRQEIEFIETGTVVLCMEGPILSRRFAKLEYELTGPDGVSARESSCLVQGEHNGPYEGENGVEGLRSYSSRPPHIPDQGPGRWKAIRWRTPDGLHAAQSCTHYGLCFRYRFRIHFHHK